MGIVMVGGKDVPALAGQCFPLRAAQLPCRPGGTSSPARLSFGRCGAQGQCAAIGEQQVRCERWKFLGNTGYLKEVADGLLILTWRAARIERCQPARQFLPPGGWVVLISQPVCLV